MSKSINELKQRFDTAKIFECLPDYARMEQFVKTNQLAITHSANNNSWFDGCGSLFDYSKNKFVAATSDFTVMNDHFAGTYLERVINDVRKQAEEDGVCLGRIRLLKLEPKTCYSLHRDPEEFRYHIPLITSNKCFFVNDDQIERMPKVGVLYRFKTKAMHTAVNASFQDRYHLVFDTFENK